MCVWSNVVQQLAGTGVHTDAASGILKNVPRDIECEYKCVVHKDIELNGAAGEIHAKRPMACVCKQSTVQRKHDNMVDEIKGLMYLETTPPIHTDPRKKPQPNVCIGRLVQQCQPTITMDWRP